MTTPTQRHTKSRRNKRRSHLRLKAQTLSRCAKCGNTTMPHMMCDNCGTYRGKQIVDVMARLDKKERKRREKEQKEHAKEQKNAPNMEELSKK